MSRVLGVTVSDDLTLGAAALRIDATSYHSAQVTPQACVGVWFTAENDVYGGNGFEHMKSHISMGSWSGLNGALACQQAPGVKQNVVVGTRACNEVQPPPGAVEMIIRGLVSTNPDWAGDNASRLTTAMLQKIY